MDIRKVRQFQIYHIQLYFYISLATFLRLSETGPTISGIHLRAG